MLFNSIASLSIFKDIAPNEKKEDIFNELKNENNESIVGDLNGMSILSGNDQNKNLNVINQSGNNEETNIPTNNKDINKMKKKKRFCC